MFFIKGSWRGPKSNSSPWNVDIFICRHTVCLDEHMLSQRCLTCEQTVRYSHRHTSICLCHSNTYAYMWTFMHKNCLLLFCMAVRNKNRAKVHLSALCQKRLPVAMQYTWSSCCHGNCFQTKREWRVIRGFAFGRVAYLCLRETSLGPQWNHQDGSSMKCVHIKSCVSSCGPEAISGMPLPPSGQKRHWTCCMFM